MAKMGRPTKYEGEKTIELAVRACRTLGCTDKQLAEFLEIDEGTLINWKYDHPEFFKSIREAKFEYDTDNVEVALRKRAEGFTQVVQEIVDGEVREVEKYFPPDPGSIRYWTSNRRREYWKDKQDVEHTGNLTLTPVLNIGVKKDK